MYTKATIFNLAKSALLLTTGNIADADTDTSTEGRIFRLHYDIALEATLEDLDLDSLSTQENLELLAEDPNNLWAFAYKYPSKCAFFRRIQSSVRKDGEDTHIEKVVRQYDGQRAIFTDQEEAIGEYIRRDVSLNQLPANAALCLAHRLAWLSAPLIVGVGANDLKEEIQKDYMIFKAAALAKDRRENENYMNPEIESSFVAHRSL